MENNKKISHISGGITHEGDKEVFRALCGALSYTEHAHNEGDTPCKECKESLDRIWMDND